MSGGDFSLNDLRFGNNQGIRPEEIQRRFDFLLSLGFSEEAIEKIQEEFPTLHCANEAKQMIDGLKERGFTDPIEMITSLSQILGLGSENIDTKIDGLKERGFTDPIKMIASFPSILGFSFENIDTKIDGLKERGFTDPPKMIASFPSILGLGFENIDTKIDGLKERGFTDPIKMITTKPQILGFSFENIDTKIDGLKERGFTDSIKMITSSPSILGLGFENIDHRLTFLNRLGRLLGMEESGIRLAEYHPIFLGYKFDKIVVTLRVLREYPDAISVVNLSMVSTLLKTNIEDMLVALSQRIEGESYADFRKRLRQIKKQKLSKEEKQKIITIELVELNKIVTRYRSAYMSGKTKKEKGKEKQIEKERGLSPSETL